MSARRLLIAAVVLAVAGAGSLAFALVPAGPVRVAAGAAPPPTGRAPLGRALPLTLDAPAIGVHAAVRTLGLNPDGTVEVPPLGSPVRSHARRALLTLRAAPADLTSEGTLR
jgi:hypothetical protein